MTTGLTAETSAKIHEALRQALPAELGDTLRGELDALAELRKNDALRTEKLTNAKQRCEDLSAKVSQLDAVIATHAALDAREQAVSARERTVKEHEIRAEMHKDARLEMKEMFLAVFRHPRVVETCIGNQAVAVSATPPTPGNQYGVPAMATTVPVNTITTRTSE